MQKLSIWKVYIVDDIEQQIQRSEAGTLFFVSDFAKTANDVFIGRVLSEFTEKGLLCRLAKGIYISLSRRVLAYSIRKWGSW